MRVNVELPQKINKAIQFTNVRINCSINAVYSLWLKSCQKMSSMSAILLNNTFQGRRPLSLTISGLLKQGASLVHDCLFQLFHRFKQSSQGTRCCGLLTPHSHGSRYIVYQTQVLTVSWPHLRFAGSIKWTFCSADSWWCFRQCEMARRPDAETRCLNSFQLCTHSEYYYFIFSRTICHNLPLTWVKINRFG